MAGAFSPQPDPHVPEEEMRQHGGNHMVPPCWKLSHLVVIHVQIRLGLFKALLNGPAYAGEPDKRFQPVGSGRVGDKIGVGARVSVNGPANNEPDSTVGLPVPCYHDLLLHELIGNGTLGTFGHLPPIPEVVVRPPSRQLFEGDRLARSLLQDALFPLGSAISIGFFLHQGTLHKAERVPGHRDHVDGAGNGLRRIKKLRTDAIDGICRNIAEGNGLLLHNLIKHLHRKLGFRTECQVCGNGALPSAMLVVLNKPFLRNKETLVKETVAVTGRVGGKDAHLAVPLPMVPQYCRATPAESAPFFTKPDSSKMSTP